MELERKWDNAIHFESTSFNEFLHHRFKQKRDILLIMGIGWDPRMNVLLNVLKSCGGEGLRQLHLVHYTPSPSFTSPYKVFIDENLKQLDELLEDWAEKRQIQIITRKQHNLYVGDEEIIKYYTDYDLSPYTDILVDISSLPKSIYFTLLLILVKKCKISPSKNLHVVACQDVELDDKIIESADDIRLFKGFMGKLNRLSLQKVPKIWAPVLAKNYSASLRLLYDQISPKDVYPILPFPSRNPRNDDDLLLEYESIFVDEWYLNPLNIIYAAEDDPLDVYRSLLQLYHQQQDALKPLGGVIMVSSCLASKLSSIGTFMAALEKDMAVVHAIGRHDPPSHMDFDFWDDNHKMRYYNSLHSIWLTGEPYEKEMG